MSEIFDEDFVLSQLQASGTMAFFNLIQLGFPLKVQISEIFEKLAPFLEHRHRSCGIQLCCQIFLLAIGFQYNDFKIGKTEIHIRPGKPDIFAKMQNAMREPNDDDIGRMFKREFVAFRLRVVGIKVRFFHARKLIVELFFFFSYKI